MTTAYIVPQFFFINNVYIYCFSMSISIILFCFKPLLSNFTLVMLPINLNDGVRLLSNVVRALKISLDNPLDFHNEIRSILLIFVRNLYIY